MGARLAGAGLHGRLDRFRAALGARLAGAGLHGRVGRFGAAEGGVEIDHVAQQDAAFDQGLAPLDDGAQGQRAFADAADHLFAAGLDALGDGDFALSREQLHAAHFTQVHAHRIVGAADFLGRRCGGDFLGRLAVAGGGFVALLVFDHIDAEFGQHRHGVFDLLGRDLTLRQGGVDVVIGDVTAFLALGDHLLDGRDHLIDQRTVGIVAAVPFVFRGIRFRRSHILSSPQPPCRGIKTCNVL